MKAAKRLALASLAALLVVGAAAWFLDHRPSVFRRLRVPDGVVVQQLKTTEDVVQHLVDQALVEARVPFCVREVRLDKHGGHSSSVTITIAGKADQFVSRYPRAAVLRSLNATVAGLRAESEIGVVRCLVSLSGVSGLNGRVADLTFDLAQARHVAISLDTQEAITLSTNTWLSPKLY